METIDLTIDIDESLSRFVLDKNYYRPSDNTVRWNAFMPAKDGTTSVYRIIGLAERLIWELGDRFVATKRKKRLLGRADIITTEVHNNSLIVQSEPNPHPRHANIINWPDPQEERKLLAIELARKAELRLIE